MTETERAAAPPEVPFGEWASPITSELLTDAGTSVSELRVDGGELWWSEFRPLEGGRYAILRRLAGGTTVEITPADVNVRTRVHEYGGGAWWVGAGTLFYTDWVDQRIYRVDPGQAPAPITPKPAAPAGDRYADGVLSPDRQWVVCVREHHPANGEVVNEIVAVPAYGDSEPQVLVSGPDFVASPRLDQAGGQIAWVQWNHPDMPWDSTELIVAPLELGPERATIGSPRTVAGGPEEAPQEPQWHPDGSLTFMSDPTGWWNLFRLPAGATEAQNLAPIEADLAGPPWVFGGSSHAMCDDGSIGVVVLAEGQARLGRIAQGRVEVVDTGLTMVGQLRALTGGVAPSGFERSSIVCIGATASLEPTVMQVSLGGAVPVQPVVVRERRDLGLPDGVISEPEHLTFPTGGGAETHALYYPPRNPAVSPPTVGAPPLLVMSHGGPTSAARCQLSLELQYWTSRGFAVVDVNYRGSIGYGRAYRNALRGQWGIADLADCVSAARHLADTGRADPARLAIRGGSAGGYTTLVALCMTDVFAAGTNRFGVADLAALARDTHKFESRYLDRLIGRWPEDAAIYAERSPINHLDGFSCPLLVLQGADDVVVPPAQSEMIVDALRSRGIPVAYILFAGEQHGFRRAENIRRSLEAELAFYGEVLGFTPHDHLPELDLHS